MNDATDLILRYGVSTLLMTALLFGTAPKLVLHVLVLLYPPSHPRRAEHLAELDQVPYRERLTWVAGQAIAILFEGTRERWNARRTKKLSKTSNTDARADMPHIPVEALEREAKRLAAIDAADIWNFDVDYPERRAARQKAIDNIHDLLNLSVSLEAHDPASETEAFLYVASNYLHRRNRPPQDD